jgi:hypothetical protein
MTPEPSVGPVAVAVPSGDEPKIKAVTAERAVDGFQSFRAPFKYLRFSLFLYFAYHIIVGLILFVVMCGASVGVYLSTVWMTLMGMEPHVIKVGEYIGYLIFVVDVVCYVAYVLSEAIDLLKNIFKQGEV